ncbi:MAG: MG284/MPN403 family protein [Bulleidia sp.]
MSSQFNGRQLTRIASLIATHYRQSLRKMESLEAQNAVAMNLKEYNDAAEYVQRVDRALQDCSSDTRFIIRNGFLKNSESKWYMNYFSRNTFYRLRRKAVSEFLTTLDF